MKCTRAPRSLAIVIIAITTLAFIAAQSAIAVDRSKSQTAPPSAAPDAPETLPKPASFLRPVAYATGAHYATSLAAADLNRDGILDLVIANSCHTSGDGGSDCSDGGAVSVLLGNGNGMFHPTTIYNSAGTAASSIAVADVNGDNVLDLLVANQCVSETDCTNGSIGVLLGNGDGTFQPAVSYVAGNGAHSVAVADLNRDGHLDLVVANACLNSGSCNNGGVSVLLGNGNGTFQAPVTYSSGGQSADFVAISDLNADGFADVVVANQCVSKSNCNNGGVAVLLGNGNGTLRSATTYNSGGYSALSVAIADVNGDGRPDILATSLCADANNCIDGIVGVLISNGSGTFKSAVAYSSVGYGASSVAIADLNGDGVPDLVVDNICKTSSNCSKGGIALLPGNGDGTFQTPLVYNSDGNNATSVAAADLDGDGKADIVTANYCTSKANCDAIVAILLNSSLLKTTTAISSSLNPSAVGQAVTFTATVTSSSSIPNGETMTFYQGNTVLGSKTTKDGTVSLMTTFSKSGTFTIKAKYPGDPFHKPSTGSLKQTVN
ncbi:MAG TPA: FG-GAP-like repeat-containing protein [Terriglobales bacterium]|nr:FG-GAP-like repeat-containing protein [Terriglobales bacterium]